MDKKIRNVLLVLLIFVVGTAVFALIKTRTKKTCDHCNIVIMDIDILRADELPCYGYSRNTTPNICQFAKKATVFKDNYSTSVLTLPDMFSIITSLYPTFHHVNTATIDKLSANIPTLTEILKKEGYRTVFIGDSEYSGTINNQNNGLRGFDMVTQEPIEKVMEELSKSSQPWFIYYYSGDLHMPYLLPKNTKPMENMPAPKNLPINQTDFDKRLNIYLKNHYKEVFNKKAIKEYSSIILSPDKPATELFYSLKSDNEKMKEYLIDVWKPEFNVYMESFDQNNSSEVSYVRMIYDTKLNLVDNKLEKVLKKLDTKESIKNTITLISSNHGESFGEHGNFSHNFSPHSELYYTPLIIKAPQLKAKQIQNTSSNMDILPTILDLTGIKKLDSFQGNSLIASINQKENLENFAMSEYWGNIILQNKKWLYFLPAEAKYIEQSMLFNKENDKDENTNVSMQNTELVKMLYKRADLLRSYSGINYKIETIPTNEIKIDPEKIKRIQKEGYF